MQSNQVCIGIFQAIQALQSTVEGLRVLREEGRRLCRYLKRVEILVSDVQPYLPEKNVPFTVLGPLLEVLSVCHEDLTPLLLEIAAKGPLAAYLQAGRMCACMHACIPMVSPDLACTRSLSPSEVPGLHRSPACGHRQAAAAGSGGGALN